MPRDPAHIEKFKAFAQGSLTLADIPHLEAETYGASDRARAVLLATLLESSLQSFLRRRMRPALNSDDRRLLFDLSGALATFSDKIIVGYAFNAFGPETRSDLDLIRIIRNEFAHSHKSFDFGEPTLAEMCRHLKSPKWPGVPHGIDFAFSALKGGADEELSSDHPKVVYIQACHILTERLITADGPKPAGDLR